MMFIKTISYFVTILFIVQNYFVSCQEKGSLSFVVDNTASMSTERVKNAINLIVEVFDSNRVHEEKILVTFNDPEVNLHSVSKTQKEFQNALSTITFGGGGDCLENALTGVELALNMSKYGSHLYVFTDNPPKDSELTDRMIELCQQKNIQVVFVIYPNRPCSQWNTSFISYYKIAHACSGQIFRLREASDAPWIIPYVKETVEGPIIPLTAKIMEPTPPTYKWNIIKYTTDELIDYAVISISGNGEIKDEGDFENKVWIQNNKVRKLSAGTGKQSVKVHASDIASVVVFGRTSFDFQYGFSELIALNMLDTVKQPFAGLRTHLSIFTTDPKEVVAEVISAQILDMKENVVQELLLQSTLKPLYFSELFSPPDTMFKIAINVKVKKNGNIIRRINTIPVQPKVSSDTGSNDDENMKIYLITGESKNITCPLKTDSLHTTKWYRNSVLQSEFRDPYYPIINAKSMHDGNYTCVVNDTSANFEVDVGWKVVPDGPDYYEENWDGKEGQSLICSVSSKVPSKYEWFLNGKPVISSTGQGDTTLITDWGDYICRVHNVHGDLLILFHVTSDGCVINKTLEKTKNIPIMLNAGSVGLLNLAYSNEQYMIVPKDKILTLSCLENVFVKFPEKNQLTATCVDGNQFVIDEKRYPFSELHCNQQIIPIIKDTKQTCFESTDSTITRIGFNDKSNFITVFEACVSVTNHVPHFAMIEITKPDSEGTDYSERYVYGVNDTTIRNYHIGNDTYTVGQLVDSTDIPFGPAQLATYIPNWKPILILQPPGATAAWSSLEVDIRKVFRDEFASSLRVVTGTSNVTETEEGLLVSRYLWKWIQNLDNMEIIVAIYVNHPTPDASDRRCYKETCNNEWIRLKEELPRLYCCDQEDFKKGFPWIKI